MTSRRRRSRCRRRDRPRRRDRRFPSSAIDLPDYATMPNILTTNSAPAVVAAVVAKPSVWVLAEVTLEAEPVTPDITVLAQLPSLRPWVRAKWAPTSYLLPRYRTSGEPAASASTVSTTDFTNPALVTAPVCSWPTQKLKPPWSVLRPSTLV